MSKPFSLKKESLVQLVDYGGVVDDCVLIHELPAEDMGKYQIFKSVLYHIPSRKFYMFFVERSGSYFTEYEFHYGEDAEGMVELKPVRIKEQVGFTWG